LTDDSVQIAQTHCQAGVSFSGKAHVIVEPLLYASESWSHGQYYYTNNVRQVASLYQHNRKHRLAGQNIQQRAVGENWRRTSAGAAEEKKVELAWTHTEKK